MNTYWYVQRYLDVQTICVFAMDGQTHRVMGRTRALLTETDREYIADGEDVDENKRYQAVSRVRDRLDELRTDIETLEEHHPDLLEEVQEIVCGDEDGG